ncbi:hypothetical protein LCGC14_0734290 [marine sediment metagenome]|uniref:Bacteriophage head to tail connecting protein n=1 Tax=marine sediment metagenome TaxID=412755 RepID=A0A0F9QTP1_9ZZZZ
MAKQRHDMEQPFSRLREAWEWSLKKLKTYRENRTNAVREYVGRYYAEDGKQGRVALNKIEQLVGIFSRQLAARRPRALVRTKNRGLKNESLRLELSLNDLVEIIRLGQTLRDIAVDAIFAMGVAKIGLGVNSADDEPQPFVEAVDLDDLVLDLKATRPDQMQFIGNRYRVPLEEAKSSPLFNAGVRKDLQASDGEDHQQQREHEAKRITQGSDFAGNHEYIPHTELWDFWLPFDDVVITMPASMTGKPLRVVEWEGPSNGPYRILSFGRVPGNILGLSPVATLMDLHRVANGTFGKAVDETLALKTVVGFQGGAEADVTRLNNTPDGQSFRMDNPRETQQMSFGKVHPELVAMATMASEEFSRAAGNLDALGGLQPQSGTLGQDRMLLQSASKRIADMQDDMIQFTAGIMGDLAWYEWNDPLLNRKVSRKLGDTGISVSMSLTRENRKGNLDDFDIDIEPYSMQHQSPSTRLGTLMEVYQLFILPNMQMMAAQGIQVNFPEFLKLISRYTDMTELNDIVMFAGDIQQGQGGTGGRPPNVSVGPKAVPQGDSAGGSDLKDVLRAFSSAGAAAA